LPASGAARGAAPGSAGDASINQTGRTRVRPAGFRLPERVGKPLVFLLCLMPAAWLAWRTYRGDFTFPIEELELETGRWTLRMLAITLAITPARRLFGWNALIKYRRMLGLFVFSYATVHILFYLALDMGFSMRFIVEDVLEHKYITIGMLAYLSLIPLAITSTKGWIRRLGKRWQKLHRLVYFAAVAGTVHYLWAVKKDTFLPLVYLAIFVVLLGYRLVAWQTGRRRAIRAG
jgi:sulfoxide reductase heme-binding subunit YedZ